MTKSPKNVMKTLTGIIILLLVVLAIIYIMTPRGPCSHVKDKLERQQCITELAISNQSVIMCNDVSNIDLKEYCISEIAIANNNIELCSLLTNQSHGSCVTDIAINTKDISLCGPLWDINERWLDVCNMQLSIIDNNTEGCFDIGFADLRDECIVELQKTRNDFELCKKIVISATRHRCMRDIALLENNIDHCKWIQDGFYRDSQCYKKLAQEFNKKEYCDRVLKLPIRVNCYERILDIVLVGPDRQLTNLHYIEEYDLDIDLNIATAPVKEVEEIDEKKDVTLKTITV